MSKALRIERVWPRWVAALMAVLFVLVFYWLNSRQYLTFQLQAADIDRFSQAIWNTLQGRFLYSTIKPGSILANHFSPYMALLAPFLLIWDDVRILFLIQIISIAATGLILYKIVEDAHPNLAPWFLLAFYLNPNLHQVTLLELRRVTLAMPFLALMLYGLYKDKRALMLIGMIGALLSKEDLGLIVAMVGVYLLLFRRDWKWGIPIALIGVGWSLGMLLWVIPAISDRGYVQTRYFMDWGSSFGEIVVNIVTHPGQVLSFMFDRDSLTALGWAIVPVAVVLPFLAADILLIAVPLTALMLLSNIPAMHELQRWYMAPIIPVLFAAVAIALTRMPARYARWSIIGLMVATLISFVLTSRAPLGGSFEPYRYQLTERHEKAWELLDLVPEEARVAAQVAFSTQLAHRDQIHVYPWLESGEEEVDYYVVGDGFAAYPFSVSDMTWEINNLVADPDLVVEREVDGIFLLRRGGEPLPSFEVDRIAEDAIKLERVEVAVADKDGVYQTLVPSPSDQEPPRISPEQQLRITLYWEALKAPGAERTVSVRLEDANGTLVAQHDMLPSNGSRPTSWWQAGWRFRDVYYLDVAGEASLGPASLDLVLYDTFSGERIAFDDNREKIHLLAVVLVKSGDRLVVRD